MKRADVTYGQLDKVLRSLGFSCRLVTDEPRARVYDHRDSEAKIILPLLPDTERVYEHHMITVQVHLDNFGIADPMTFAAKLQKAG